MPTRGEEEERGVVVQAEVEASATNSDGHEIPVFDMSSGDAEDDEREYFLDDILRRIIGVEAILRGWAGGEDEKRRRRIDEMKEGIARNRLERLEKEEDEEQERVEDEDFTRCVVRRWMLEKGFGFVETESRENAFLHVSAMSSGEVPKIGSVVFARILVDESRADAGKRAVEAHSLQAWRERRARLRAATVAVQAAKAAKLAVVFTQRAEQKVKELLPLPPGLATGTVAQSIGVDTVDQNDTRQDGEGGVRQSDDWTRGDDPGALVGGSGRVVWGADQDVPRGFAGQIREPRARGAEEDHQGDEGEGGEE